MADGASTTLWTPSARMPGESQALAAVASGSSSTTPPDEAREDAGRHVHFRILYRTNTTGGGGGGPLMS